MDPFQAEEEKPSAPFTNIPPWFREDASSINKIPNKYTWQHLYSTHGRILISVIHQHINTAFKGRLSPPEAV